MHVEDRGHKLKKKQVKIELNKRHLTKMEKL